MDCYIPGEVILWPKSERLENGGELFEIFNKKIEIISSLADIFEYYHISSKILRSRFKTIPLKVRVNEGEEKKFSISAQKTDKFEFAVPNYCVRPNHDGLSFKNDFIQQTFQKLNLQNPKPICGQNVKVVILDTGVNREELESKDALCEQYNVNKTNRISIYPDDAVGHGTVIANIINRITPKAELYSIKIMETENDGTIWSLINGIFLAEISIKPDIYNLSLSISSEIETCPVCKTPTQIQMPGQLSKIFEMLNQREDNNPFIVAAAGNNRNQITMPACFGNICAVGAYDVINERREDYSMYEKVPAERYILAPGGCSDDAIAEKGAIPNKAFYGTSFSAAYITGAASKVLCSLKNGSKSRNNFREELLYYFKSNCKKPDDYHSDLFGLGVVYFDDKYCSCNIMINKINFNHCNFEEYFIQRYPSQQIDKRTNILNKYLYKREFLTSIDRIQYLYNLKSLKMHDNKIKDITPLSKLTQLEELELSRNPISDITPLKGLTNLSSLDLGGTQVSDISSLKELTNLRDLGLMETRVSDITPLKGLTNLKVLNLFGTQVSDITSLKRLTNLRELILIKTGVSDITPLKGLTNLRELSLFGTQVSDITSLKGLTNLKYLNLFGTQVSDITSLKELTNLRELILDGTPVSQQNIEALKKALPDCDIRS